MLKFLLNRLFYGLVVLFGLVTVVFFLFFAMPGRAVDGICPKCTQEQKKVIEASLGLDQPAHIQYFLYLNSISPISIYKDSPAAKKEYNYNVLFSIGNGNAVVIKPPYFQRSFKTSRRVSEVLAETIEGTLWLAFTAMIFATVFGVIFGMIAALNQNSFWDHFLVSTSTIGISAPSFVSALLISMIFGFYLSEYTGLSMTGYLWERNPITRMLDLKLENLILPAFTLGIRPLAIITQLTRSSMLEVMSQDYIRTAKAKGLGKYTIVLKHALKNAMNPVITAVTGWLASLIAGAFFVEKIFSWRGIGKETIDAVLGLDLPIIMGVTIVIGIAFIFINITVDILYALIDPRVRLR